jgi:hypothetical protein
MTTPRSLACFALSALCGALGFAVAVRCLEVRCA